MAKSGAIKAGRAFVEIGGDNNPLIRTLKSSTKLLNDYAARAFSIGTKMVAAGAALLTPVYMAIKAGSDLEETMNKFNVVFGDNAKAVKAWGDEYGDQVGRSKRQMADFLASNQDLLVPMGFEPGAAEKMSKDITKLSVDLASFNNKQDADVLNDLQAALTGSGEVMKKYGVIVSQAAVNQELLNMQIDPKNATEAQKAQARWNIIIRGTTAAQGDAIRSANSWANQEKALTATIEDQAGAIGSKLLPVVTPLLTMFKDGVKTVGSFVAENAGLVFAVAGAGAALVTLGGAALGVAVALKIAAIATGVLTSVVGAVLSPVGLLVGGLAAVVYYSGIGGKAIDWLTSRFGFLGEFAQETFGYLKAALNAGEFQLAAEFLWASIKVAWFRGTKDINEKISEWSDYFKSVWNETNTAAVTFFIDTWADLQKAWVETTRFISDAWDTAIGSMKSVWLKFYEVATKGQLDLKYGINPEEGSSDAFIKDALTSGIDTFLNSARQSNSAETNRKIFDRENEASAELDRIKQNREDAKNQVNQDEQDKQAAEFLQNLNAGMRRDNPLTQAQIEREKLRLQMENKGLLLPDVDKTNLGQSAASGGADIKNAPGFKATNIGGGGPVNLRTQEGAKLIADLLNRSQEDEMLDVLKDGNGLQVAMIEAIKALNRPLSLEG